MEANTPDTLGGRIARLRKEKGMTQLELADRMGVTDKAVSKWERDVSCPDIASMPRLAEVLGATVDELMQARPGAAAPRPKPAGKQAGRLVELALKGVAAAMGIAVAVLTMLDALDSQAAFLMLGLGLACLARQKRRKAPRTITAKSARRPLPYGSPRADFARFRAGAGAGREQSACCGLYKARPGRAVFAWIPFAPARHGWRFGKEIAANPAACRKYKHKKNTA